MKLAVDVASRTDRQNLECLDILDVDQVKDGAVYPDPEPRAIRPFAAHALDVGQVEWVFCCCDLAQRIFHLGPALGGHAAQVACRVSVQDDRPHP